MTDRELLELAAKAYFAQDVADGVCSFWWDEKEEAIVYIHGDNQDHNGNDVELLWIPLNDDGDALRLGVKLGFKLELSNSAAICHCNDDQRTLFREYPGFRNSMKDGAGCARLAIVRAAAEIGKDMK